MKAIQLSAACVAIALLPMAINAEDQKAGTDANSAESRKHFDKLDNDRDGRLSKLEARSDGALTFTRVDTDGDGYIDRMEYMRRDASGESTSGNPAKESVPSSQSPQSSSPNSPGTSSKTDPNQLQGTQPSGNRDRDEKPREK